MPGGVIGMVFAAVIFAGGHRGPTSATGHHRVSGELQLATERRFQLWANLNPPRLLRLRGGQELDPAVSATLCALGLSRYAAAFEREGIQERNMPDLTAEDLAELGLSESERTAFLAHQAVPSTIRKPPGSALDQDVADTLAELELSQYSTAFEQEGIHGRNLPDLSAEDLTELVNAHSRVCVYAPCACALLHRKSWFDAQDNIAIDLDCDATFPTM